MRSHGGMHVAGVILNLGIHPQLGFYSYQQTERSGTDDHALPQRVLAANRHSHGIDLLTLFAG